MSYDIDFCFNTENKEAFAIATSRLEAGKFTGIVADMPNSYYHSLSEYVSSTALKSLIYKSPAHYIYNKESGESFVSPSMRLGSAAHCKFLEPHMFNEEFRVAPKYDGRTKEGKQIKAELDMETRTLLTEEQMEDVEGMVRSVKSNSRAMSLVRDAIYELAFFWECPFSGLMMRAKLDGLMDDDFLEFKTCRDASPSGFSRDAYNMNYDLSLVHYRMAVEQLCEKRVGAYVFAVENTAPYVFQRYRVSDEVYETGHKKWLHAVTLMEECLRTGLWPGYVDESIEDEVMLMPPSWAMKKTISEGDEVDGI